jgi:NTE family protein
MNKKVALVLGSGGARGTAHIGVIRELESRGYEITSVAGTSMGAMVGGIYAAGKLDEYEEWLTNLTQREILGLVDFTLSSNGIIKANRVLKEIQKFIPDSNIEDLEIPFTSITTDIKNKKEVVLREGSLFESIRASISIPMVITPLSAKDTLFVDGGVLNPVPTNRIERFEGDTLIAVDVNARIPQEEMPGDKVVEKDFFESHNLNLLASFNKRVHDLIPHNPKKEPTPRYFDLVGDTSSLMLAQITSLTLQLCPPDQLIRISRDSCGTYDFHKSARQIEIGRKQAIKILDEML